MPSLASADRCLPARPGGGWGLPYWIAQELARLELVRPLEDQDDDGQEGGDHGPEQFEPPDDHDPAPPAA